MLHLILPCEIVNHIYEYNPEHRERMKWVLQDIRYTQYCEVCKKVIMKKVYSMRGCDLVCCSNECLDILSGV